MMYKEKLGDDFWEPKEAFDTYGEPCNNCQNCDELFDCSQGHRMKTLKMASGPFEDLQFRRKGGCPDHLLRTEGKWIGDETAPFSSDYGGTSTSILRSW